MLTSGSGIRRGILLSAVLLTPLLGSVLAQDDTSSTSSFSFRFPTCVNTCVDSEGSCGTNQAKCMCKAARGDFLTNILDCMFQECASELADADEDFLSPMESGCDAINKPIPDSSLKAAEIVSSSLVSKLAAETTTQATKTAATTTTTHAASTTPTSKTKSTTTNTHTTKSATDVTSQVGHSSSAPTTDAPSTSVPSTTTAFVDPSSSASSTSGSHATTTQNSPNSDPTDSSPFATPNVASWHSSSYAWAALPVALALMLR